MALFVIKIASEHATSIPGDKNYHFYLTVSPQSPISLLAAIFQYSLNPQSRGSPNA
jgi:hypothetical protein